MTIQNSTRVRVVDLDIPFGRLVLLLVKVAIAAIPAALIVGAIGVLFWLLVLSIVVARP